jgi:hypothetical protein
VPLLNTFGLLAQLLNTSSLLVQLLNTFVSACAIAQGRGRARLLGNIPNTFLLSSALLLVLMLSFLAQLLKVMLCS